MAWKYSGCLQLRLNLPVDLSSAEDFGDWVRVEVCYLVSVQDIRKYAATD